MAVAAAAALDAKESEASQLRAKAQRLLRERSERTSELEALQETYHRMERAITRTCEQTAALQAESTRGCTSDQRRHAMQMATVQKALRREKQRRLAARNEVGALQRQLVKKRQQRDALGPKRSELEAAKAAAATRQAQAEAALAATAKLRREVEAAEMELRAPEQSPREAAAIAQRRRVELEDEYERLQRAIGRMQQQGAATARGNGARGTLAATRTRGRPPTEREKLSEALAAEKAERDVQAKILDADIERWRQATTRLQSELRPLRALHARTPQRSLAEAGATDRYADGEALVEAARWHAEARAFAAEARRVERAQLLLLRERDAEREGWRDFREQVASRAPQGKERASDAEELRQTQASLEQSRAEATELMQSERTIRLQLDQAGRRLQAMNEMAAELEAVV